MISIKFEIEISGYGRVDDQLREFFKDIKAEVFKKAKSSQKIYFNIKDICTMIKSENYLQDNIIDYSFGFSVIGTAVYHGNSKVKDFNKRYESITENFIY